MVRDHMLNIEDVGCYSAGVIDFRRLLIKHSRVLFVRIILKDAHFPKSLFLPTQMDNMMGFWAYHNINMFNMYFPELGNPILFLRWA